MAVGNDVDKCVFSVRNKFAKICSEVQHAFETAPLPREATKTIGRRLYWRDLAYWHLLQFPRMRDVSIREHYELMEWVEDPALLRKWQKGQTGFDPQLTNTD